MELAPGVRVGSRRLAEALPAPPGFQVFAVEGDDALEVIAPNAHLRLRAGAPASWEAGRRLRQASPLAAVAEVDWPTVDGWRVWVRPRVQSGVDVRSLDEEARASLNATLVSAGVNVMAATVADLVLDANGVIRYAPLGLAESQLKAATLASLLSEPTTPAAGIRSGPAMVTSVRPAPVAIPPALVIVTLSVDDSALLGCVALRSATPLRDVERAAARPGRWLWGAVSEPDRGPRLVAQAARAGLTAEIVFTGAPIPTFLPAMVAGGLAQLPLFVPTGIPTLDIALIGGLGVTALFSLIRQGRRIGPARRAASATGAWQAWCRTERTEGPERALLELERRIAVSADASPIRRDLADAVDEAWTRLFAGDAHAAAAIGVAARAVDLALSTPEEPDAVRMIAVLRKEPT